MWPKSLILLPHRGLAILSSNQRFEQNRENSRLPDVPINLGGPMDPGRIELPSTGCKPVALPLSYGPTKIYRGSSILTKSGQTTPTMLQARCVYSINKTAPRRIRQAHRGEWHRTTSSGQFCFCAQKQNYLFGKILNILVPHFSQVPVIAFRAAPPFPLKDVSWASFIILLALHLTQYASV